MVTEILPAAVILNGVAAHAVASTASSDSDPLPVAPDRRGTHHPLPVDVQDPMEAPHIELYGVPLITAAKEFDVNFPVGVTPGALWAARSALSLWQFLSCSTNESICYLTGV